MKSLAILLTVGILRGACPTPPNTSDWGQFAWQSGIGVGYGWPPSGTPPPAYTNLSIDSLGSVSGQSQLPSQTGRLQTQVRIRQTPASTTTAVAPFACMRFESISLEFHSRAILEGLRSRIWPC